MVHTQPHLSNRTTWLRASVLGANDGIISTASLIIGVASAGTSKENMLIAGLIGLVSGAFSMAAGEYVSVSSQTDLEEAELTMERDSIRDHFAAETHELANIYQQRGLTPELSQQVAEQLMANDPLSAHARDDIGLSMDHRADPLQAALSSALAFAIGALLPLLIALLASENITFYVAVSTVLFLSLLGSMSAFLGRASMFKGALRVTLWGSLAMAVSAYIGHLFS